MSDENVQDQESTVSETQPTEIPEDQQGGQGQTQEGVVDSTLLNEESEKEDIPPSDPGEQVPESYEAFKDINGKEYAPETVERFAQAAKKAGLSQGKAQELFESIVPTAQEHIMKDLRAKAEQWALDCEKDPEIGGANFGANKAIAIFGYREFATPELRTILNASGLGNHPEVVRHFYRLGKTLQQDKGVHGDASSAPEKRRRYPKSNMVTDD